MTNPPDTLKRSRMRLLRLTALLLAVGLVAAACGDDDVDDAADEVEAAAEDAVDEAEDAVDEAEDEVDEVDEDAAAEPAADGMDEVDALAVDGSVNVSGSSTVEPVSSRVAELIDEAGGSMQVTVSGPGTGDGFAAFCVGETDISDASRPIKDEEAATCEENGINYVELRVAFDGIAVMTNPDNPVECLTYTDIWGLMSAPAEEAGVDNWSEATQIVETSTDLPDAPLEIFAPGTESGTYDSFIEIVLEEEAENQGYEGEEFIRRDFPGQAEDNVIIQGISGSSSSFGWVGFAFAEANADVVKVLEIDGGDGCVAPTADTIADGSYPVSRSLYIYVNTDKLAENQAIEGYVNYYLDEAYPEAVVNAFGPDAGYIALPDDLLSETRTAWEDAKA